MTPRSCREKVEMHANQLRGGRVSTYLFPVLRWSWGICLYREIGQSESGMLTISLVGFCCRKQLHAPMQLLVTVPISSFPSHVTIIDPSVLRFVRLRHVNSDPRDACLMRKGIFLLTYSGPSRKFSLRHCEWPSEPEQLSLQAPNNQ